MFYFLVAYAAFMAAAGVAAAAAQAHVTADPRLATMAQMLMIHAAAAFGILAFGRATPAPTAYVVAVSIIVTGVTCFCGDLAMRVFFDGRLFPKAAPLGGILILIGWLGVVIASVLAAIRDRA